MVKAIMGVKGSGKTKQLIELVKAAIESETGDVVVIEKSSNLTFNIPYTARLISSENYHLDSYEFLKGFLSGLNAGNYDITHVFIDSLYKIIGTEDPEAAEEFFAWLEEFGKKENVKFTITISADKELAPEGIKKYF